MRFLYAIFYIIALGGAVLVFGLIYPRKYVFEDVFPFNSFPFENEGQVYHKLKIMKWKTKLPDISMIMAKIIPGFILKKRIEHTEKIPALIKETCVAEAAHIFAGVLGFGCVFICHGTGGWILSILFGVINAVYVIIQRFNRPRLKQVNEMLKKKS